MKETNLNCVAQLQSGASRVKSYAGVLITNVFLGFNSFKDMFAIKTELTKFFFPRKYLDFTDQ